MPFETVRWRIGQAVRRSLRSVRDDHPLRQVYRVARRWPPARAIWRLIAASVGADKWRDVSAYADRGGAFGALAAGAPTFPSPPPFEDERFFDDLISRIEACEPPRPPGEDLVVVVNNGLSAGGAERQIVLTLIGLKARGVRAAFIGEYMGAPGLDFHLQSLQTAGIECRAPPNVTRPGDRLYSAISRPVAESLARFPAATMIEVLDMAAALRGMNPSVVHLWQDETSTKHAVSALIVGAPRIVLSGRNVNPTHFEFHQPYMRAAYRALAASPRIVLSNNSHAGARSYAEWLGIDDSLIRVVHNGVDVASWPEHGGADRAAFREMLAVAPDQPLVLGVFRLADEKRPLLWLEAALEMRRRVPNAAFAIVGDGPMRPEVENMIRRLDLAGAVRLLGETRDVGRAMAAADVFVLTSRQEGIPNALLEAQHYGLACLITRAGGAVEAVADGRTGRIADDDGAPALGAAMADLWLDKALRARAKTDGPRFVERHFGLERMIDSTMALYRHPRARSRKVDTGFRTERAKK